MSATDLTNRVFYFSSTRSPNVIWVPLADLDFAEGREPQWLDPRDEELVGDVAARLVPRALPYGVLAGAAAV